MPQDQPTLPELPIAAYRRLSDLQDGIDSYYTAEQMRSYALAAIAASSPKGAALPEGVWQPIETAPKDGTVVVAFYRPNLGRVHSGCYATAMFDPDVGRWVNPEDSDDWYAEPCHWMPLPQPPQESA